MSKGLGRVERAALQVLEDGKAMTALDIAAACENVSTVPESVYRSYVRALRTLARKGKIEDLGRHFRFGRRCYAVPAAAKAYRERAKAVLGEEWPVARPL